MLTGTIHQERGNTHSPPTQDHTRTPTCVMEDDESTFFERASEPLVEARHRSLSRAVETPAPRRCHDSPWLVVLALYWVGMIIIATCAAQEGDWKRLVQGMDDDDQLCGGSQMPGHHGVVADGMESRPFVYFACLQYGRRRPTEGRRRRRGQDVTSGDEL